MRVFSLFWEPIGDLIGGGTPKNLRRFRGLAALLCQMPHLVFSKADSPELIARVECISARFFAIEAFSVPFPSVSHGNWPLLSTNGSSAATSRDPAPVPFPADTVGFAPKFREE